MPKVATKRSEQSALSKAVKNVKEKLSKTTVGIYHVLL